VVVLTDRDAMVLAGTVLVVDDNAENRALACATLEDEGIRVEVAASGAEGIASFTSAQIDCVLLDVRMPDLDGVEVCRRIRALPGGADVPILFVTAQRDLDTFDRAREAGGDDFISKPYRPNELIARVGASIRLRRMVAERDELADLIKQQRDDMMRLQLQKDQLIAFLVHDLKNPVNAIELHGQRIVRDPKASERSRDAAAKIHAETQALLRMILNLLDLTKADEGRLQPASQRIELDEFLHDVAIDMRPRAQAAQVVLVVDAHGVAMTADPDLARRVIENLIDNALRHAPEDSTIHVTAALDGDFVELRVADAGAGIPMTMRERVFDRFVQGGTESMRTSRGLGLAFCKLAVEAHGGSIWIEDASPGAIFCLRLPRADLQR
jgi:signal transduction histidine kinase